MECLKISGKSKKSAGGSTADVKCLDLKLLYF